MSNDSKKKAVKQRRLTYHEQLIVAQKDWEQDPDRIQFISEQQEISCLRDLSLEKVVTFNINEFIKKHPTDLITSDIQSQILALQERGQVLLNQQNELWAEETATLKLNEKHALIKTPNAAILTKTNPSVDGQTFHLEQVQSFKMSYQNKRIMCFNGTERSIAEVWLMHPKRREYEALTFDPSIKGEQNEHYNIWTGFTKQPKQGNCSKYWAHVEDNICNGNKEAYQYLRKWLAYLFQCPHIVHTAIVLQGSQGVGKNSFVDPLGVLLGPHYKPLSNMHELVSNFNSHLKNAVLVHANEALWGGLKKDIGTVKAMITDKLCMIEIKGKDRIMVLNFKHFIFSSNENWPVHMDRDDRRFFVLKVGEDKKEKHDYFQEITTELDNGGHEALLFDLLNEDIKTFNPRQIPSCSESFDIKLESADSVERYLHEALQIGSLSIGNDNNASTSWPDTIQKPSFYADYKAWCEKNNEKIQTSPSFGKTIKKCIKSINDGPRVSTVGSRQRSYTLPGLMKARKEFGDAFKIAPEKIFDNYEPPVQEPVQEKTFQSDLPF